jgi:hypothetical protein
MNREYEKRLTWYKQPIWTCRCTGHVNLTHQEAWNSEKAIKKSVEVVVCFVDIASIVDYQLSLNSLLFLINVHLL